MRPDAVLLLAFGAPTKAEEVRPFLANVLRGRHVARERLEEVAGHYEAVGGGSPLTELTARQARALEEALRRDGLPLRVYVGMRNWHPFLLDTLRAMRADGVRRAVGFIMSPQQSDAGWERYKRDVAEAQRRLGDGAPVVEFVSPWYAHPLFIRSVAERAEAAFTRIPAARRGKAALVFTAHSVPATAADSSRYAAQLHDGASRVASALGFGRFEIAYQSRSGAPGARWLGPSVAEVLHRLAAQGAMDVVVVPLGFVCDHVEVLYDLDIEARAVARFLGLHFIRAATVGEQPGFIRMMAEVVREHVGRL